MPYLKTKKYKSFDDYLIKHIIYPTDAKNLSKSGMFYVEFIIEKEGSVLNAKIVKGKELYPPLDN